MCSGLLLKWNFGGMWIITRQQWWSMYHVKGMNASLLQCSIKKMYAGAFS